MDQTTPAALVKRFGSPLYIYDADTIRERCRQLKNASTQFDLYYACKANTNPAIVQLIFKQGFGIETVSPGEIAVARKVGVPISNITFTCGSITEQELVSIVKQKIHTHLDSLTQVAYIGTHFPGTAISVRLNLGVGAGSHSHVITGGPDSKFGVPIEHLAQLNKLCRQYRLRVTGLHQHIGSNILAAPMFLKAMDVLLAAATQFPDVEQLDFGGGFGVPYLPGQKPLDIPSLGKQVAARLIAFEKKYGRRLRYTFEPGRYLVAECGTLLTTVTDLKKNPSKTFIGVDSGMGHLIRPAMYDSYHHIENVSRPRAKKARVTIAGNYCESGDILAKDRQLPMPQIGDILAIRNAGAYGFAMSSHYNLRPLPAEVLLSGKTARRI